jgi:hypothetical protein
MDLAINRIYNLPAVSVDTTALGTFLITTAQVEAAPAGVVCVTILSDVNIALVDGTANGTYANSPFRCWAGVERVMLWSGGPLKAISSAGTATVAVGLGCRQ